MADDPLGRAGRRFPLDDQRTKQSTSRSTGALTRPLIVGNWKMHGLADDLGEIEMIASDVAVRERAMDVVLCLPATLIERAHRVSGGRLAIGGEACHAEIAGPYTGEISAEMLRDAGATSVIVGHSERRRSNDESDADVASYALAARRASLDAIICVGETAEQRAKGRSVTTVGAQLIGSVPTEMTSATCAIGYEPLWAIGSGIMPTYTEIAAMHSAIRACLIRHLGSEGRAMRILYGGSVEPDNAAAILGLPHVDGALVGGASLRARDFIALLRAAR